MSDWPWKVYVQSDKNKGKMAWTDWVLRHNWAALIGISTLGQTFSVGGCGWSEMMKNSADSCKLASNDSLKIYDEAMSE